MHRGRALTAALAAALVVTACGIRPQSSPSAIEPDEVPFGLLEGDSGAVVPDAPGPTDVVTVYFLGPDGLLPLEREVTRDPGPRRVLRVLFAGPTPGEADLGVRSSLDPEVTPPTVERDGRLLAVDLPAEFLTEGEAEITALAQIVFTLTELEPRARVQFLLDGDAVEVPRGDGVLTGEPVGRGDYRSVESPGVETTT